MELSIESLKKSVFGTDQVLVEDGFYENLLVFLNFLKKDFVSKGNDLHRLIDLKESIDFIFFNLSVNQLVWRKEAREIFVKKFFEILISEDFEESTFLDLLKYFCSLVGVADLIILDPIDLESGEEIGWGVGNDQIDQILETFSDWESKGIYYFLDALSKNRYPKEIA